MKPGAAAALVLLVLSCATGPYVQREDRIQRLVDLINKGGVNEVKGLAETPFLFDGEIVLLQKDLNSLWDNFKAAGFVMKNAKVLEIVRPAADSYKAFDDSMDVKTFFAKYLDRDTSMVKLAADGGVFYLLLGKEVGGYPKIRGLRGPVK